MELNATKIKFFPWFLCHRVIVILEDNLAQQNLQGDARFSFCFQHENISFIFNINPYRNTSHVFGS